MPADKPASKKAAQSLARGAPRDYPQDEIQRFLKEDRLDRRTAAKVRRLLGRKPPA